MTLKVRLAATMVVVLVAVVALQFLLMERERRDLATRLSLLSTEVDRSTAVFVQRTHEIAAGREPAAIQELLRGIRADSLPTAGSQHAVRVFVWSNHGGPSGPPFPDQQSDQQSDPRSDPQSDGVTQLDRFAAAFSSDSSNGRPVVVEDHEIVVRRKSATRDTTWTYRSSELRPSARPIQGTIRQKHLFLTLNDSLAPRAAGPDSDFVVNLPLPAGDSDSLYSLQVRYPFGQLTEELARSRRHGLWWLVGLLGAGILATIAIAVQFTRPIQTLEQSFARVQRGELDVTVPTGRNDEIGHLTESFNEMVARLHESKQIEHRLAESEHLASLGRLAAGVAHEVRNPLNAILLTLQHLRDKGQEPAAGSMSAVSRNDDDLAQRRDLDKYYAMVTAEIARLDRMVTSFLDLARSGELQVQRLDVGESLRAAVDLFQPLARERGVQLTSEVAPGLMLEGDPARLPMVWNNLLANAIEAMSTGGSLHVGAARRGTEIEIVFADSGPGIPEAARARIWEPFYSARDGGTGLGLSIVRSVVERHGGDVVAECGPGVGTRMIVRLPVDHTVAVSLTSGSAP